MKPYLVALGLSLVISWILTPAVKKLAFHLGAVDRPNARKVHHRIMPRMGGLAIFIGFMTAALTTLELTTDVIGILLGGAAIAAVGMVDDMIQLSAKVKLVGQIVAALIPVLFGVRIEWLNNPWGGYFYLDYLSVPFTVFWIVSLTNVVNLIDGLDGLAAGVSAIALGLPIMDTAFAILRRYKNGRPIFQPDKGHIHHRLLAMGFSQRQAVIFMYLISAGLCLAAVLLTEVDGVYALVLLGVLITIIFIGAKKIGILKDR